MISRAPWKSLEQGLGMRCLFSHQPAGGSRTPALLECRMQNERRERMKKVVEWLRGAWWAARCLVFDLGWLCWGAWVCSAEEMRDERGYGDGTR